jgi:hypothetical protein
LIVSSFPCIAVNPDKTSEYIALTTRALQAVSKPTPDIVQRFQMFVDKIHSYIHPNHPQSIQPALFGQWASSSNCSPSVINACVRAQEQLDMRKPDEKNARRYATFKLFPKYEKVMWSTIQGMKTNRKPRAIQATTPAATVATGRMFHPYQHYLHKEWGEHFPICFAAGKNAEELSRWLDAFSPGKTQFLEDDFSLFDSTVCAAIQKVAMAQFKKCHMDRNNPWGWAIREAQLVAPGYSRFGYRYQIDGTVRSGVADTCLTNSMLNAYAHLYALHLCNPEMEFTILLRKIAMCVMGDDNILMAESDVETGQLEKHIRSLGFMPKLERRFRVEDLVFLNMRPYPMDDGTHKFGNKIGRVLARLGSTTTIPVDWKAYLHGVFTAFRASSSHVPIFNDLVDVAIHPDYGVLAHYDRGYERSNEMRRCLQYNVFSQTATRESEATKEFLCTLYRITPAELAELRALLRSITRFPCVISHYLIDRVCSIDCA